MAAANRFAAILRTMEMAERSRQEVEVKRMGYCILLLISSGAILNFIKVAHTLAILLVLCAGAMLGATLAARFYRPKLPPEVRGWLEAFGQNPGAKELSQELRHFEKLGVLAERTHPKLMELLERAARAVERVHNSARSEAWQKLAKEKETAALLERSVRSAREGLVDCVWMGRHLFRRKRQHTATFERRQEDPAWGTAHLVDIEAVVWDIEKLAANLSGDLSGLSTNQTPLEQVLAGLDEHHQAQSELDEEGDSVVGLMN